MRAPVRAPMRTAVRALLALATLVIVSGARAPFTYLRPETRPAAPGPAHPDQPALPDPLIRRRLQHVGVRAPRAPGGRGGAEQAADRGFSPHRSSPRLFHPVHGLNNAVKSAAAGALAGSHRSHRQVVHRAQLDRQPIPLPIQLSKADREKIKKRISDTELKHANRLCLKDSPQPALELEGGPKGARTWLIHRHMRKAGGTSLEYVLADACGQQGHHLHVEWTPIPEASGRYGGTAPHGQCWERPHYVVASIRHPIDRILSQYFFEGGKHQCWQVALRYGQKADCKNHTRLDDYYPFDQWIDMSERNRDKAWREPERNMGSKAGRPYIRNYYSRMLGTHGQGDVDLWVVLDKGGLLRRSPRPAPACLRNADFVGMKRYSAWHDLHVENDSDKERKARERVLRAELMERYSHVIDKLKQDNAEDIAMYETIVQEATAQAQQLAGPV